ncbi:MAG: DUF6797 domain-containing protein [Fuerstiella sp.]
MMIRVLFAFLGLACSVSSLSADLTSELLKEPAANLANAAVKEGDPSRGAILFYQKRSTCLQCHQDPAQDPKARESRSGPDLADWIAAPTGIDLVNSILRPSERIRPGYELYSVVTLEGKVANGLLVAKQPMVVLRDLLQPEKQQSFHPGTLEELTRSDVSPMPQKLANMLNSRQQFLDLVAYLIELSEGERQAARRLKPAAHLYASAPLPEYEANIDHAGMIDDLGEPNLKSGAAIYGRLCANCHGTLTSAGSLPTALNFSTGRFRNGSDPYSMYQTLTHGYGMMQSQAWMVPQQKYDVIHYVRQTFLKPKNTGQYFEVTDSWRAGLPKGKLTGPAAANAEPWVAMNYGSTLMNTYEVGESGSNFAQKGIAMRLDEGPGGISRGRHWMVFDHDTMRMAAAYSGDEFIDWKGIHFNGQHAIHPRIRSTAVIQNLTGPGWANPMTGSWTDQRVEGRDGRQYGPLPGQWAQYKGMYRHGDRTVISYSVGEASILETPSLKSAGDHSLYLRHLQIGARNHELKLQVAQRSSDSMTETSLAGSAVLFSNGSVASKSRSGRIGDGKTFAECDHTEALDMTKHDFTVIAELKTKQDGTLFARTAAGKKWVPNAKAIFIRSGRLCFDVGWVGVVRSDQKINDGRWHTVAVTGEAETGEVNLWVDGERSGSEILKSKGQESRFVTRLGFAADDFPFDDNQFQGQLRSIVYVDRRCSKHEMFDVQPSAIEGVIAEWKCVENTEGSIRNQLSNTDHAKMMFGDTQTDVQQQLVVGFDSNLADASVAAVNDRVVLTIPASTSPTDLHVWMSSVDSTDEAKFVAEQQDSASVADVDFKTLTAGGQPRFPEPVETKIRPGDSKLAFQADVISRPASNPWNARVRLAGFDFLDEGKSAVVAAWDGDVWRVDGIDQAEGKLTWSRIASGLFQPLGVKVLDGRIYVTCRDQLVILNDLNGDGFTDFYECFNSDHQVTEHFHEFAMGLQVDQAGNFYYAKSARHAKKAVVPHHGTLLKVSADGQSTEIVATGFRAANGVCMNPDGSFVVTDQEGHWNPKNRINWVRPGGFYGNMYGYHDVTDASDEAMQQPLCWITNSFDRSPAELLWVPKNVWGNLSGSLLNLSYGYGQIHVVPHEEIQGQMQGGMCPLPMPQFPTGLVRGRFHESSEALFACGMFAWAGNQKQPGGFYRIRRTEEPAWVPNSLHVSSKNVVIGLTEAVNAKSAMNVQNYAVTVWDLKRTANYGSRHFNERQLSVTQAKCSSDGTSIELTLPDLEPTWGMEIRCRWKSKDGRSIERTIHNTIHKL